MGLYMKFAKLEGDVATKGYEKWTALHSFQFGVGRAITSGEGRGANRTASHTSVSEIVVTKDLDETSLGLWEDALTGPMKADVKFAWTTATDNKEILTITLWETGVSGWSTSSGGERPGETVSLNFTKIEYKPHFYTDDGVSITPKMKTWDLAKQVIS